MTHHLSNVRIEFQSLLQSRKLFTIRVDVGEQQSGQEVVDLLKVILPSLLVLAHSESCQEAVIVDPGDEQGKDLKSLAIVHLFHAVEQLTVQELGHQVTPTILHKFTEVREQFQLPDQIEEDTFRGPREVTDEMRDFRSGFDDLIRIRVRVVQQEE